MLVLSTGRLWKRLAFFIFSTRRQSCCDVVVVRCQQPVGGTVAHALCSCRQTAQTESDQRDRRGGLRQPDFPPSAVSTDARWTAFTARGSLLLTRAFVAFAESWTTTS